MPRFTAYKSLFKISGWDEWKGIFLHSKEKSGGILCGFRAFLTPSVRKKPLSGAAPGDFEQALRAEKGWGQVCTDFRTTATQTV